MAGEQSPELKDPDEETELSFRISPHATPVPISADDSPNASPAPVATVNLEIKS